MNLQNCQSCQNHHQSSHHRHLKDNADSWNTEGNNERGSIGDDKKKCMSSFSWIVINESCGANIPFPIPYAPMHSWIMSTQMAAQQFTEKGSAID